MGRKNSIEAVNITYGVFRASPLFTALKEQVFKGKKPVDFKGECLVLTSLPMTKDQLQVCRVMANIFVPNLVTRSNGKEDRSLPNYPRIKELSAMLEDVVDAYDTDDYSLRIEDESVMENVGFDEHYNNYRLIFRNINI